jgi:hypothetical protein
MKILANEVAVVTTDTPRIKINSVHLIELQVSEEAKLRLSQKREEAIAFLRLHKRYLLDEGSKKPNWGNGITQIEKFIPAFLKTSTSFFKESV